MNSRARGLIVGIFTLALLASCTPVPTPTGEKIENIEAFNEALLDFYNAEKAQDWETYWSYFTPATKSDIPYKEFSAYMENTPKLSSYKILSIKNYGPDRELPELLQASVEVVVERTVKESPNQYGIDRNIDFWWYVNGKWVWVVRK